MNVIVTTDSKRVDVSDLVVDKLPSIPAKMISIANILGFTVDELRAKGFTIEEEY